MTTGRDGLSRRSHLHLHDIFFSTAACKTYSLSSAKRRGSQSRHVREFSPTRWLWCSCLYVYINRLLQDTRLYGRFPLHASDHHQEADEIQFVFYMYYPELFNYLELIPLVLFCVALFVYVYFSIRKMEMVKSKLGMASDDGRISRNIRGSLPFVWPESLTYASRPRRHLSVSSFRHHWEYRRHHHENKIQDGAGYLDHNILYSVIRTKR